MEKKNFLSLGIVTRKRKSSQDVQNKTKKLKTEKNSRDSEQVGILRSISQGKTRFKNEPDADCKSYHLKKRFLTDGDGTFEKTVTKRIGKVVETFSSRSITADVSQEGEENTKNLLESTSKESGWKDEEYLADAENLKVKVAKNIIQLLKEENTIPFIARYRKDLTEGLDPDKLRRIKATYDYINQVRSKAKQLIQQVSSKGPIPLSLTYRIQAAKTIEELEFIGAPFKKDTKGSLAERAKRLGLDEPARLLLEGVSIPDLEHFVKPKVKGLENIGQVKTGIQHVIADLLSKNPEIQYMLKKIVTSERIILQSKFKVMKNKKNEGTSKYHLYKDFSQLVKAIKPHQMLAINRGESEKELSVKIIVPDDLWNPLRKYCYEKWIIQGKGNGWRNTLLDDSLHDAIKRLLCPFVTRRVRAMLNKEAEDEAINVFSSNLKQLLLSPPCRGKVVMGVDPGFRNGCKVAIVSPIGELFEVDKFFLNENNDSCSKKIINLVCKYECETIALGNGVGCRETETLLSDLIKKKVFGLLNVSYTIVSEQGVSIYSCSSLATEEFPDLDPTFIGALSLARRLQDPLSELVKVEPTHLGVGMYQHDVGDKKLGSILDEIVSECVSFVGVDINSASFYLLRRVAGLNAMKAREIIKYRTSNCPFRTREDFKKVKGIKAKTFEQCAGFCRIVSSTARCRKEDCCKNKLNPLDETCIHPESYETAIKVTKRLGVNLNELGSQKFIEKVKNEMKSVSLESLAENCGTSLNNMTLIVDTLMKPKDFDLRNSFSGPIFRKGIKNIHDLSPGDQITGIVRNMVPFGAFVDVGVGNDGLIHISQMRQEKLQINMRVKVEVTSVEIYRRRIQLKLLSVIT